MAPCWRGADWFKPCSHLPALCSLKCSAPCPLFNERQIVWVSEKDLHADRPYTDTCACRQTHRHACRSQPDSQTDRLARLAPHAERHTHRPSRRSPCPFRGGFTEQPVWLHQFTAPDSGIFKGIPGWISTQPRDPVFNQSVQMNRYQEPSNRDPVKPPWYWLHTSLLHYGSQ